MKTIRNPVRQTPQSERTVPSRPVTMPQRGSAVRIEHPLPRQQQPRALSASQRMRAINHQTMPATARRTPQAASKPQKKAQPRNWLLYGAFGVLSMTGLGVLLLIVGMVIIYSGGILPGVSAGGIDLGGMSQAEAESALSDGWQFLTLSDGERTWSAVRAQLGIEIDTAATAADAYAQGRSAGNPVSALFGAEVTPYMSVNTDTLREALESVFLRVNIPATNAGVALVNGQVQATPASNGRFLDIESTVNRLQASGTAGLFDGHIALVMVETTPEVLDATPIVQAATQLLSSPLDLRVYDPVTGDIINWTVQPQTWANWITAAPDANSPTGLALTLADAPLRDYLTMQSGVFDETRYIDMDAAITALQNAIAVNETSTTLRVYHHDRQHVVQSGETISSIAWDYGVPYPWVQQANPGVENPNIGTTLTIPSVDNFLPNPVVPEKRIEVSIPEQRVRVYENGLLIHDWVASTGINTSPTWSGVYQILSHEDNAYAGNWNLWMPYFMGVYQPVPNSAFTNGFHGYPTRGGGQILWRNNLGTRVTYGCIMVSDENAAWLFDWAETGVVVEIQG